MSSAQTDGFITLPRQDLLAQPDLADELVDCYIRIFNATGQGEWAENWTPEQVRAKFFGDTSDADAAFFTLMRAGGELAGLSMVTVESVERMLAARDLPPGLQTEEHLANLKNRLRWFAGGGSVAFHREFGIRKEFRNGLEYVLPLMCHPQAAARNSGAAFSYCWTSKKLGRLYNITMGLDFRVIYAFNDPMEHVVIGESADLMVRRLRLPVADIQVEFAAKTAARQRKQP
ncbi:MAG: hypothetical protein AAB692_02835 [Patescibacteria group bacterium]